MASSLNMRATGWADPSPLRRTLRTIVRACDGEEVGDGWEGSNLFNKGKRLLTCWQGRRRSGKGNQLMVSLSLRCYPSYALSEVSLFDVTIMPDVRIVVLL